MTLFTPGPVTTSESLKQIIKDIKNVVEEMIEIYHLSHKSL